MGNAVDNKNECIMFRDVLRDYCNKSENSKNQTMGKESSPGEKDMMNSWKKEEKGVMERDAINLENAESSHCASFSTLIILPHLIMPLRNFSLICKN
ncbi:unnamed protein product [Wuchereria bancrofti]|uniref:Uncharacterized protein n=1 Tax=Wuchereria bancrofti TaxID=6293 RepID=A0A3P7GAD8_WUCBA|nr:unnamed protein product [Wuchereria bancrofti]